MKPCLLFCAIVAAACASAIIPGDVDDSGTVNATDVQSVINTALGLSNLDAANIDHAGGADAIDVQLVINAALNIDIDADNDELADVAELNLSTDPSEPDTDNDTVNDGDEIVAATDPGTAQHFPDLGIGASLHGKQVFPVDNAWNTPIDQDDADPNSDAIIDRIGRFANFHPDFGANWDGGPFGIPYIVVDPSTPKYTVDFLYDDQSDPGPYPIPANVPIEGGADSGGDRHIIVIDRMNWILYEIFAFYPPGKGGVGYTAGSGAIFDLRSNALRPDGWTSADAAGLSIFAGLVRYDEVYEQAEIKHAIRFTVEETRHAYIHPATHYASDLTDADVPPMGMRVRLKDGFNIDGFAEHNKVILRAMKKYGLIVADNGSNWYFSGVPDARWDDEELNELKSLEGDSFEVVKMGTLHTD
jgi:hypothetical protein